MRKIYFFYIFIVFSLILNSNLFAEEELYVEGISYESQNTSESIAVVNGNLLKKGDQVQDYKVVDIQPNYVRVSKMDGSREKDLYVTGGQKVSAEPVMSDSKHQEGVNLPLVEKDSKASGDFPVETIYASNEENLQKNAADVLTNSVTALAKAKEISAIADLKKLYTASNVYLMESNGAVPTMDQLIKTGMISDAFQSGVKGEYRFTLKSSGDGYGVWVNADPTNKASLLRHFMVDEDGQVRVDNKKPATKTSELYKV